MVKLDTVEAVLEWASDTDADNALHPLTPWEDREARRQEKDRGIAAYLAECVRLRQWFEDNQRPATGMGGSLIIERRMPTYWSEQMRDAMKDKR